MVNKTEKKILEAVIELIANQGLTSATTKSIAEAAGVNEVTLFRRFGNKDKLLSTAMQYQASQLAEEAFHYSGDLVTDLTSLVTVYQDMWLKRGGFVVNVLSEIIRRPELLGKTHPPEVIMKKTTELLNRYQVAEKLPKGNPVLMMAELLGPIMALGLAKYAARLEHLPSIEPKAHVERFLASYKLESS